MELIANLRSLNRKVKAERQIKTKKEKQEIFARANSRYTDHIMTDVKIDFEADQLHRSVRDQINAVEFDYINCARQNKEVYLKFLEQEKEREGKDPLEDDVLILPFDTDSQEAISVEEAVAENYGLTHSKKRANTFYHGVPCDPKLRQNIVTFRGQFKDKKANLSDVAQHVRIIPIVM